MNFSVPRSTVEFMNELATEFPEAARVIHARRQEERGEILPHMEIGDLIYWVGEVYGRSFAQDPRAQQPQQDLRRFLQHLEERFEVGDQDIDDLIATSFLEGLSLTGPSLPGIRALLPRKMSAWYAAACEAV